MLSWRWSILVRSSADPMRGFGLALLVVALLTAVAAPILAPHRIDDAFRGLLDAPPTIPRVTGADGRLHAPFIYRWKLVNQLEQRYEEDRTARLPLIWMQAGRLVGS